MQWASEHLNDEDYYSSCDDDMMIDLTKLPEHIKKYNDEKISKTWPEFPLICGYKSATDWGIIREKGHKNYVSTQEYKWNKWPKFCLGGMYLTSVSVIKQLHQLSKTAKPLRTDDVWITGILRNRLGMPALMVVFPEPAIAQHSHFQKKKMQDYLNDSLKKYDSKSICRC